MSIRNPNDLWSLEYIQQAMQKVDIGDPNSGQLLDRSFWAKVYETYEAIYQNPEQASLAVGELITGWNTDLSKDPIALPSEVLVTRAIQAYEYVHPYRNTEVGKPLLDRVHNMLAGSDNISPLHALWTLEAIEQFAEYYKDSDKYRDYQFSFVANNGGSVSISNIRNAGFPKWLGNDDLSWLPLGDSTSENEVLYCADYKPGTYFMDEPAKPIPLPTCLTDYFNYMHSQSTESMPALENVASPYAMIANTHVTSQFQQEIKDQLQNNAESALNYFFRDITNQLLEIYFIDAKLPESQQNISSAIDTFKNMLEFYQPYVPATIYQTVLEQSQPQTELYLHDNQMKLYKTLQDLGSGDTDCVVLNNRSWANPGHMGSPKIDYYSPMPMDFNPPMLSSSSYLDNTSAGLGIASLGTFAAIAVGAVYLAKKFGFFRGTAAGANHQPLNVPVDVQVGNDPLTGQGDPAPYQNHR